MIKQIGKIRKFIQEFNAFLKEEHSMTTANINAVYSEDMEELLDSLEILEDVKSGKKKCYFCERAVSVKEITSVFPADNDVQICCYSISCHRSLINEGV